ncbi:hypothetical protein [Deinococcus sp. QL22]|uniref:DUF7669 domain-containing protein n=1 Tax=Deinococcus sp. QL22 TaxID=2939437 RepID=UPI002016F8C7|nr:hypothetical protein [Deinococcus sp. QL22]UQN04838.1 hypothetical protein M1R55_07840 [Deinococcus sp. QL22]
MTCRDEALKTAKALVEDRTSKTFHVSELLDAMRANRTKYSVSTIRTQVSSKMCRNAPNHTSGYDDFERVGYALYRLL